MRSSWSTAVPLFLAASLFLPGLGATHLWDVDEAIFAACAAEMWDAGEWVTPTLNEQQFGHKPALVYWQMMAGFSVFGVDEWAARLPSALWALITVWLTLRIGRRLFDDSVGRWAAISLTTSLMFAVIARAATIDATLVALIVAAMERFVAWRFPAGGDSPERRIPLLGAVALYAALGAAFLAKGPVGVVLPIAAIGLFLVWDLSRGGVLEDDEKPWRLGAAARAVAAMLRPSNVVRAVWSLRPVLGVAIASALAAPWYVAVAYETGGAWPAEFFGVHNVGRFLAPMEHHGGGIWYYPVVMLVGFFPWSCFAGPLLFYVASSEPERRRERVLLACWVVGMTIPVALAGTKLPHYVLPAFPALAMLVGALAASGDAAAKAIRTKWTSPAAIALVISGLVASVGATIALAFLAPQFKWLGVLLAPAAVVGVAAWRLARAQEFDRSFAAFAAAGAATFLIAFHVAAPRVDQARGIEAQVALLRNAAKNLAAENSADVGSFHLVQPSLNFYARRTFRPLRTADLKKFCDESAPGSVVAASSWAFEQLPPELRSRLRVVGATPLFLKSGTMVVAEVQLETASQSPSIPR